MNSSSFQRMTILTRGNGVPCGIKLYILIIVPYFCQTKERSFLWNKYRNGMINLCANYALNNFVFITL